MSILPGVAIMVVVEAEVRERFEAADRTLGKVLQTLELAGRNMTGLIETMNGYMELSDRRMSRIETNLERLDDKLEQWIGQSDARMAQSEARLSRIEENLDLLIKAITPEHPNGKQGQ